MSFKSGVRPDPQDQGEFHLDNQKTYRGKKSKYTDGEILDIFYKADTTRDGLLSTAEIYTMLQKRDFRCSQADVVKLVKEYDTDGNGYIDSNEFIVMFRALFPDK